MRTSTAYLGATAALALAVVTPVSADSYRFSVVAGHLDRPVGIAVEGSETVYFTEVPDPGVGGGANGVSSLDLDTGVVTRLNSGEPEPTNIALDRDGDLYWTCKSAGVILRLAEGAVAPFATGLEEPSGIAIGRRGAVYITEIPEPGVPAGRNRVSVIRGDDKIVLSTGEPEPTDVAVARNGDLYWTCKTAGVILRRSYGKVGVFRDKLDHPSGIAIDHKGETLYFTEVPTPGVPGDQGGKNRVRAINLRTGALRTIHTGDPEPTDIAVARNGNLYWTCTSAGVIIEAKRRGARD
jgi:sugar lactone lactonase YvrE